MLWFIQHYLWDLGWHPDIAENEVDAWEHGYLPVNRLFAEAVVDELGGAGAGLVMLHDYHLYRVAPLGARRRARRLPAPVRAHPLGAVATTGACCPTHIRARRLRGPAGQRRRRLSHRALRATTSCRAASTCSTPTSTSPAATVRVDGREVWVRAYPVSIDPDASATRRQLAARGARRSRSCSQRRREHLVVRVDRLDLSKNIIRGFMAFDRFLELHPEFKERITFLALLQPSREDVEEYVDVPRARHARRRRHQHQARQHRLDADRRCASRTTSPSPSRPTSTTTRSWSTRSSTA